MHPRIRHLLLAVAAMSATLTTSTPATAAVAEGPSPDDAGRLSQVWAAQPGRGTIGSSPTYANGSIYYIEDAYAVGDPAWGERITRRDAVTGRLLPFAAPGIEALYLTQPVSDGVSIFTISAYEHADPVAHIRAYTPSGRPSWNRKLPGERYTLGIVVSGPLVIAAGELGCDPPGTGDCKRTSVNAWWAATGKPAWNRTVAGGTPRMVAAAGQLTVHTTAGGNGVLTAVDALTGRLLWARTGVTGGPMAADAGSIYLAAGDLCALRAEDGKRRWCVEDRTYHDVTVAEGGLYAVAGRQLQTVAGRQVVALTTDGLARWAVPAQATGPLTVANGVVYLQNYTQIESSAEPPPPDHPTELRALRATTGATLARLQVSSAYSPGAVTVGGGRVFTTAYLTTVLAYAPSSESPSTQALAPAVWSVSRGQIASLG